MLDEKNINRNDDLGKLIQEVGDEMLPPPALEKSVIAGAPYRGRIGAGTHIRKFAGAVLAYAAGIMLLLGAIFLLPRLFNQYPPVATNPNTTPYQSEPMTTPATTEQPFIVPPIDDPVEYWLSFYNCAEFEEFYRELSTVNPAPLVIPCGIESEYLISRYMFRGDSHPQFEKPSIDHAYQSTTKLFELTVFGSLNPIDDSYRDPMNDDRLQKQCDYMIYLRSFVQPSYIESLEDLQLKSFEGNGDNPNRDYYDDPCCAWDGDHLTYYTAWEWDPNTMRRYDVVQGDRVLLSFVTKVNTMNAINLHDTLCELVMENLVSLGSPQQPPSHPHEYTSVTSDGLFCTDGAMVTYTCKYCDDTYTENIPAPGHDYQNGVCSRCGEKEPDQSIVDGSQGLEYELNGDSYTVVGIGTYTDTHLVIPATYKGVPVTSIKNRAFFGNKSILFITISEGITEIGVQAFGQCSQLINLKVPDSVTRIGAYAFVGCQELSEVTIGSGMTNIEEGAFYQCRSLERITYNGAEAEWNAIKKELDWDTDTSDYTIRFLEDTYVTSEGSQGLKYGLNKDGYTVVSIGTCTDTELVIPSTYNGKPVTAIGDSAFSWCTDLTCVTIPDTVKSIGAQAFIYCESLASITIPDSVVTIGDHAFSDCYSLASVTMGDSVTSIGWSAFSDCLKLRSVRLSESLTVLEEDLFSSCWELTSIQIPDSVTVIGMGAFSGCPLTSINIPSNVTKIDEAAFFGCDFASITIPANVTYIGTRAFYNCDMLTGITFDGAQAKWNAIEKGEDWDSGMPNYTVYCTDGNIVQ